MDASAHHRKAEELAAKAAEYLGRGDGQETAAVWAAVAQVHATLALAAAATSEGTPAAPEQRKSAQATRIFLTQQHRQMSSEDGPSRGDSTAGPGSWRPTRGLCPGRALPPVTGLVRPTCPGKARGPPDGHRGGTPGSAVHPTPGKTRSARPVRGRPWNRRRCAPTATTVHTDRRNCAYRPSLQHGRPSAMRPWTAQYDDLQRSKVTHAGTEKKRPASARIRS